MFNFLLYYKVAPKGNGADIIYLDSYFSGKLTLYSMKKAHSAWGRDGVTNTAQKELLISRDDSR